MNIWPLIIRKVGVFCVRVISKSVNYCCVIMKRKKWVPCIALVVVIFLLKWHSNSRPSALAPIKESTKSELRPIMTRERQRPTEPGAYGHPFPLTSNTDEGKARIAAGWERHGFNEEVCRKISLHRQINGNPPFMLCKAIQEGYVKLTRVLPAPAWQSSLITQLSRSSVHSNEK